MNESPKHVLVSGGTGFIGSRVVSLLLGGGHTVTVISRDAGKVAAAFGKRAAACTMDALPERFDAVVNLAGAKVNKRWTKAYKQELTQSRVGVTASLRTAAEQRGASVFISGSAIGYYGDCGDEVCTEQSAAGSGFLAKLAAQWEAASQSGKLRVANIRTGIVLHRSGGALKTLVPLFKCFMGGRVGNGRQYLSWVHLDDIASLFAFALQNDVRGPLNGAAPNPVTNQEFTRALAKAVHRPVSLPVPALALRLLYGEMADMLLKGQRVMPRRTLESGFAFKYPELAPALDAAINERP